MRRLQIEGEVALGKSTRIIADGEDISGHVRNVTLDLSADSFHKAFIEYQPVVVNADVGAIHTHVCALCGEVHEAPDDN